MAKTWLGFGNDEHTAKQNQLENFDNENTFVGAVISNNRNKIEELCYNYKKQRYNYDRMLLPENRGAVGECCFHMCFLFPSPENLKMAEWLLSKNPRLIDTSKYYRCKDIKLSSLYIYLYVYFFTQLHLRTITDTIVVYTYYIVNIPVSYI